MPSFGGGRPPKLDDEQQAELLEVLREGQPWESAEIRHLLTEEFDVEYHPDYLGTLLRDLGLSYATPHPERSNRSKQLENEADDEPLDKRESDECGWIVDDDGCTAGSNQ